LQGFLATVQNYVKLGQVSDPVRELRVLVTPSSVLRHVTKYEPIVKTMLDVPHT
jgi:hypothetical protein